LSEGDLETKGQAHNLGEICVESEFKPSGKRRKTKKPALKELNVKSKKSAAHNREL
jgi:hypothetical protein